MSARKHHDGAAERVQWIEVHICVIRSAEPTPLVLAYLAGVEESDRRILVGAFFRGQVAIL